MRSIQPMLLTLLVVATLIIAGCGGGDGGGDSSEQAVPVTTTATFPVSQAMKTLVVSGFSSDFTAQQTGADLCNGSGNRTASPATTPTTFNVTPTETIDSYSSVQTITLNWTNCTPAYSATTLTAYYDASNYLPLGFNSPGVNYGVYLEEPAYPLTVSIGDTGIIGTVDLYTDSTETTSNGFMDASYVVTADTASTAILTLISKIYDEYNTLTATEQDASKITTAGVLTPISVKISYSNGANITFTYN